MQQNGKLIALVFSFLCFVFFGARNEINEKEVEKIDFEVSKTESLEKIISNIKTDTAWINRLQRQAVEDNSTLEDKLLSEAIWIIDYKKINWEK